MGSKHLPLWFIDTRFDALGSASFNSATETVFA